MKQGRLIVMSRESEEEQAPMYVNHPNDVSPEQMAYEATLPVKEQEEKPF